MMENDIGARFVRMCNSLQDPSLVARFQRLCGVKGTFPEKVPADLSAQERDQSAQDQSAQEQDQSAQDQSAQEQNQSAQDQSAQEREQSGPRRRVPASGVGNGAAARDELNGMQGGAGLEGAAGASEDTARAKPLRRNSLTGDVGQEFLIHNKFLFYLFTFGTELGNEMFFIIFFPFVLWNVDPLVSRRLIVVWAWNLFVGQSTKDMVRWSRPASPPVVKVEVFYNSEYSMPSTHAMTGTAIPFCLFMLTYGRWEYPFVFGLSVALSWSVLVCVSRVYMGMHSVLEVITGFLYTLLILAVFQPFLERIDTFYMMGAYAPLVILVSHVGFGLVAFSLDSWSTSRGDTAQGLATAAGVALATYVNYQLGLLEDYPLSSLPLTLPPLSTALVVRSLLRFLVGVAVLLVTRMGMKAVTIPFLCQAYGLPLDDVRGARQLMRVELPYRYIVYTVVGFNCVTLVPLLFSLLYLA